MGLPQQIKDEHARAEEDFKAAYPDRVAAEESDDASDVQGELTQADETDVVADVTPTVEQLNTSEQQDFKHKYSVLKGKYNSEVPKLQGQLSDLAGEVSSLRSALDNAAVKEPAEQTSHLSSNEKLAHLNEQYGEDFVKDITSVVRGEIGDVKSDVESIRSKQQETVQDKGFMTLDSLYPTWRETNDDPLFLSWLNDVDNLSGVRRQDILQNAFSNNEFERVVAVFKAFEVDPTQMQSSTEPKPEPKP
ncbi:MAG: hypothetical protein R8M45_07895, partial [Ghiorsea sp.]